jgi:hypothetical protein
MYKWENAYTATPGEGMLAWHTLLVLVQMRIGLEVITAWEILCRTVEKILRQTECNVRTPLAPDFCILLHCMQHLLRNMLVAVLFKA